MRNMFYGIYIYVLAALSYNLFCTIVGFNISKIHHCAVYHSTALVTQFSESEKDILVTHNLILLLLKLVAMPA